MKKSFASCNDPPTSAEVPPPPDPPQQRLEPGRRTPPPLSPQPRPEPASHYPPSSSSEPRSSSPLPRSPLRPKPEPEPATTHPRPSLPQPKPEQARTPPRSSLPPSHAPAWYRPPYSPEPEPELPPRPRLIIFSLEEIQSVTQQWNEDLVVGRGRTSMVFRGKLGNEQTVAIKRIHKDPNTEEQFSREYKQEKALLGQVCGHENIIALIGMAWKEKERILVLEFVPNGTLFDNLHDRQKLLTWEIRMKIALGAARAMDYIHHAVPGPILHRDIRTRNILLDQTYSTKLIDFGSAIYQPQKLQYRLIVGKEPYVAPEYRQKNRLSTKCDIYSFGVVLLELITGREPAREGEICITEWARARLGDTANWDEVVPRMIDDRIRETVPSTDMMQMMKLANDCIHDDFSERPKSDQVVAQLLEISCLSD